MPDFLEKLDRLAHQARKEDPPYVHVADQVLSRIRLERDPFARPFTLFAFISASAAALAVVLAVHALSQMIDPTWFLLQEMPIALP